MRLQPSAMGYVVVLFTISSVVGSNPSPIYCQNARQDSLVAAHFARAVDLFNEHDDTGESMAEAKKEFAFVLKLNPRHAPARAYQGLVALENQQLDSASAAFGDALDIDPSCPEAHVGRAQFMRAKMQWSASYDELRLAVRLAPESILARMELVSVLLHRAEAPITPDCYTEAIPHLKKVIELDSNARQAHLDLAESYEHLKLWRDAIAHYQEVLRIGQTPEDMDVWVYELHKTVAQCYEQLGEYDHAIDSMKQYLANLRELGADEETLKATEQKISDLQHKVSR